LNRVFHIGTLNPADLGRNSGSSSLEGRCLSVSLCPHAWQQIARLGGYDLHEMTSPTGYFLDVHAVENDAALMETIRQWGLREGLITEERRWKAWSYDDEWEQWRYTIEESEEDAIEQIDLDGIYDDPLTEAVGPDDGPAIEEIIAAVTTEKLVERVGGGRVGDAVTAMDFVIMAWAANEAGRALGHPLDGLWWNETYDPDCLSAPRGAIFPERVASWTSSTLSFDAVDDEEELEAFANAQDQTQTFGM
jgi:hypothetical protein